MKRFVLLVAILSLYCCQAQPETIELEPNDSQEAPPKVILEKADRHADIKQKEMQKKTSVRLDRTLFEQISFIVTDRYIQFLLRPQLDEQIKGTLDVFWKQGNVYLLGNVQPKEDIEVTITDQVRNVLFKDVFYTASGFKFSGVAKHTYRVRVTNQGKIEKLVILHVSQKVKAPQTAAKKTEMIGAQEKLFYALTKLQTALSESKTGHILDQQIANYVLHQSTAYSHFQILQSFIIVLVSCAQVMFVTRLLKTDIVV